MNCHSWRVIRKKYQKDDSTGEITLKDEVSDIFISSVCDIVSEKMRVPYSELCKFRDLLWSAVEDDLSNLLKSYKEYYFEFCANEIQKFFHVPKDKFVWPNYTYADHAKLLPVWENIESYMRTVIIINGQEKSISGRTVTYDQIVKLAFDEPKANYTVTFRNDEISGTMIKGTVLYSIKTKTIFDVADTSNA